MKNQGVEIFFKSFIAGFVISAFTVQMKFDSWKSVGETVENIFINYMYCFVMGCGTGVGTMLGIFMFLIVKKNLKNERWFNYVPIFFNWGRMDEN